MVRMEAARLLMAALLLEHLPLSRRAGSWRSSRSSVARSLTSRPTELLSPRSWRKARRSQVWTRTPPMSWNPLLEPAYPDAAGLDAIETLIVPRAVDLGGFEARRALPASQRQMVGPFIFFDHAGPADAPAGVGADVRPHPHIGLATVTYLFVGEIQHRDSTGSDRIIRAGDVNWMVAGRGVTHSERTPAETRKRPHSAHGIQTWVALPAAHEDTAPRFEHYAEKTLPFFEGEGVRLRLLVGAAYGETASASIFSDTFYADVQLGPHARIPLPDDHEDRGVYVVEGSISVAGQSFESARLLVFRPRDRIAVKAGETGARVILLGGAPLEGRATSGGILSPPAGRRSKRRRTNGANAIGAAAFSTFRRETATNSFRCRRKSSTQRGLDPPGSVLLSRARSDDFQDRPVGRVEMPPRDPTCALDLADEFDAAATCCQAIRRSAEPGCVRSSTASRWTTRKSAFTAAKRFWSVWRWVSWRLRQECPVFV